MYRIDHIPQFIEPYHPWPVQNVFYFILLFTPKILFHFFPILVACINVFGVSPYIPLFRYMRILQKYSVISHVFFFCNLQKWHLAKSCIWFLTLLIEQYASEPYWTSTYLGTDTRSGSRVSLTPHVARTPIACSSLQTETQCTLPLWTWEKMSTLFRGAL